MVIYGISRNIEASVIQYMEQELASSPWSNIVVEKAFNRIYDIPVATFEKQGAVCVRLEDTDHEPAEIGEVSTRRLPVVLIDIFAANDGQRLDLKDFLIFILKKGMPYYEYEIEGGSIIDKTENGRIRITNIDDTAVNLSLDKSSLEVHDRYRHLLTLEASLGRVEV